MSSKIYSIKCTNCGAPLEIRGGGRITTVTCKYCGSVLDMANNYKVLTQFRDKYRPPVPFTLGMQGKVKGVEWTIIGWVAYKTTTFPLERWSEFFLYSPLYGYGWLIYENGRISFSRRVRNFPLREWEDKRRPKTVFYNRGHYIAAEDPYSIEIDFVEGELSWIAKADDKIRCWDYNGAGGKSVTIEQSGKETEVYLNERLDALEVYNSFKVPNEKRVFSDDEKHTGKKNQKNRENTKSDDPVFVKWLSGLILILAIMVAVSFTLPVTLVDYKGTKSTTQVFTIDSEAFLTQIDLTTSSATVLDRCILTLKKQNEKIFDLDEFGIHSSDKNLKYTWKHGSNGVTIYIKLKKGIYDLSLKIKDKLPANSYIRLIVKERYARLVYIIPLLILFIVVLLYNIRGKFGNENGTELFWWILASIVLAGIFGPAILVFIIVIYFMSRPFMRQYRDRKYGSDE